MSRLRALFLFKYMQNKQDFSLQGVQQIITTLGLYDEQTLEQYLQEYDWRVIDWEGKAISLNQKFQIVLENFQPVFQDPPVRPRGKIPWLTVSMALIAGGFFVNYSGISTPDFLANPSDGLSGRPLGQNNQYHLSREGSFDPNNSQRPQLTTQKPPVGIFQPSQSNQTFGEHAQLNMAELPVNIGFSEKLRNDADLSILVHGDYNPGYHELQNQGTKNFIQQIYERLHFDLYLSPGDVIGGQVPSESPDTVLGLYNDLFTSFGSSIFSGEIPFIFSLGNHDGGTEGSLNASKQAYEDSNPIGAAFYQHIHTSRPRMQLTQVASENPHIVPERYAVKFALTDQSHILIIVLPGYSPHSVLNNHEWLESVLLSEDAKSARAKIAVSHLPPFAFGSVRSQPPGVPDPNGYLNEYLNQGDQTVDILKQHGVNMLVAGHHHVGYLGEVNGMTILHSGSASDVRWFPDTGNSALPSLSMVQIQERQDKVNIFVSFLNPDNFQPYHIGQFPEALPNIGYSRVAPLIP